MSNLSPKIINSIILKNGLNIKKNLGQNFLYDQNILDKIIDFSNISNEDTILEIGPGLGSLTDKLLEKAKKVIAVEIDKGLCSILREKYKDYDNFLLIEGDFLDISNENAKEKLFIDADSIKCVANLPYYITSPIIMSLLSLPFITEINIMVQKEVGDRIFAKPNTKDYGILTLAIEYYAEASHYFIVSRDCFYPKPNVDSMVLKLIKNNNSYYYKNKTLSNQYLFSVIKKSFSQRRKKLVNSLSSQGDIEKTAIEAALNKLNLNPNIRAENLTLEQYITLSELIAQN